MTRTLFCCLLLLSASPLVAAREARMHGPNGDGGNCPDTITATSAAPLPLLRAAIPVPAHRGKVKAPTTFRSGDDDSFHAPRWHSFLPGMFR